MVVGSRAGIVDPASLPVPVDVYGAEEIARLGEVDLGEVLGRIAPSFNSTRRAAGDGAALHVATLRGMNGDQVLVLVNGKRRHSVAFTKLLAAAGQGTGPATRLPASARIRTTSPARTAERSYSCNAPGNRTTRALRSWPARPCRSVSRFEFYAFGGYSGREAVSDGLYRKADWVPRNVSYVYPDGFFPVEESEMDDGSAVGGLRGSFGEWSGDLVSASVRGGSDSEPPTRSTHPTQPNTSQPIRVPTEPRSPPTRVPWMCSVDPSTSASGRSTRTRSAISSWARPRPSWRWAAPSAAIPTGWRRVTGHRGPADRVTSPAATQRPIT